MMRIVPVKNQKVESTTANLASKEKGTNPKFFSVAVIKDGLYVQGWTSEIDYILDAESAEELAEEARREFTLDRKSR